MTLAEYLALTPGDVIRHKRTRRLRVCVDFGYSETPRPYATKAYRHATTCVHVLKVGHSWTDPRPTTCIDIYTALAAYSVTGRKGCSHAAAMRARNWQQPPGLIWNRYGARRLA